MAIRAADRLRHLQKALRLSPVDLAQALDIPERRVRQLLKSEDKPTLALVARLRRTFPQVNPDWLLLGEGDIFLARAQMAQLYGSNYIGSNSGTCIQNIYQCEKCHPTEEALKLQVADKTRIIQLLELQLRRFYEDLSFT